MENEEYNNSAYVPSLVTICLQSIAKNFDKIQSLDNVPEQYHDTIISLLSLSLPLDVVSKAIDNETYWERRCMHSFVNCDVSRHEGSWKTLFFERFLAEVIETAKDVESFDIIYSALKLSAPYVQTLVLKQCPSHFPLGQIISKLTHLRSFTISYASYDITHDFKLDLNGYDANNIGMRLDDMLSLASALKDSQLIDLGIHSSSVNDDLLKLLCKGLRFNESLMFLSLKSNKITNTGARYLAKLLKHRGLFDTLVLTNNQIGIEGAGFLGSALLVNKSLKCLDLRLNMLKDAGVKLILQSLVSNPSLEHLNISGTALGESSLQTLSAMMPSLRLKTLNISANPLHHTMARYIITGLQQGTGTQKLS
ncbi:hypothetical protein PCE1_002019 [Barthelona sp. PCE]